MSTADKLDELYRRKARMLLEAKEMLELHSINNLTPEQDKQVDNWLLGIEETQKEINKLEAEDAEESAGAGFGDYLTGLDAELAAIERDQHDRVQAGRQRNAARARRAALSRTAAGRRTPPGNMTRPGSTEPEPRRHAVLQCRRRQADRYAY